MNLDEERVVIESNHLYQKVQRAVPEVVTCSSEAPVARIMRRTSSCSIGRPLPNPAVAMRRLLMPGTPPAARRGLKSEHLSGGRKPCSEVAVYVWPGVKSPVRGRVCIWW